MWLFVCWNVCIYCYCGLWVGISCPFDVWCLLCCCLHLTRQAGGGGGKQYDCGNIPRRQHECKWETVLWKWSYVPHLSWYFAKMIICDPFIVILCENDHMCPIYRDTLRKWSYVSHLSWYFAKIIICAPFIVILCENDQMCPIYRDTLPWQTQAYVLNTTTIIIILKDSKI
jgi:hypothetical protein